MQTKKEGFPKKAPDSFFAFAVVGSAALNLFLYPDRKDK